EAAGDRTGHIVTIIDRATRARSLICHVRQIAPCRRLMAGLHLGVEPAAIVSKHGVDEVARVFGARVSLETPDELAVFVVRRTSAALARVVTALALYHIAALHALIFQLELAAGFLGHVTHP